MDLDALELLQLENEFTAFVAAAVNNLLKKTPAAKKLDFIAAHGHTVYHQPHIGLTFQMLNGGMLAAKTGLPVVCDFRRQDVALSGQGAPLVPKGDQLLFSHYDACLNLGGVANISFPKAECMLAYDIGPANLLLNALSQREGHLYDAGGQLAREGRVISSLLRKLDSLVYYSLPAPKSLGREWIEAEVMPFFNTDEHATIDCLATATTHISGQLARATEHLSTSSRILVTGGGAFNDFLIEKFQQQTAAQVEVLDPLLIEAKEAIVFALLGKLRLEGKMNVLPEVTGASRATVSGAIYLP